jgi:hypothetical protein
MRQMQLMTACMAIGSAAVFGAQQASATTITKWDFNAIGLQAAPYNTPAPTTGAGSAKGLGMTNAYNGGNTESDDVLLTAGTANPAFNENTWRIRGAQTPTGHNGWATAAAGAAQYSQGLEADASTAGYKNIQFSFDWFSTTQGIRDLQFQYNLNTGNAAGWTNFGGTSPTGTYVATSNDYYNAPASPTITVDLSSIAGANNDPNLGVRLVSAFDSTGHVVGDYASAALSSGATVIYNNNSGNWRFDNLTFSGTSVPEPASLVLAVLGMCGVAIGSLRRRIG